MYNPFPQSGISVFLVSPEHGAGAYKKTNITYEARWEEEEEVTV